MKLLSALASLLIAPVLYAQEYSVKIEEDYSKPASSLFNAGDEFQNNSIENGMYVSKAARMHAQIDFPYSLYDRQSNCIKSSDMEFTIVKLKGNKEDFICVQVDPNGDKAYPYLVFQYNELGDWKLTNYLQDKTYASGKATVNAGVTPNVIKIAHRYSKVSYYVNGELATELKADNTLEIRWYNNKVYSKNQKFVLGLDKLLLGGCVTDKEDLAKEQKRKEEEAAKIAAEQPAPPDPNEVIDYNKVYEQEFPDADIILFRDKFEKWGAKNQKGELLFAPKFDYFDGFYGGVAVMWGQGGAALIDRTGKELTPYKFSEISKFSEGVALAKSDCDENGEHCKYSYIDKTGKTVLELPAKYVSAGSFYDGLAVVSVLASGTGESISDYKYGYIDITGKEVIPPTFYNAGDFRYNRAPVESEDYKVGYINKTGKLVIPYKYYKMGNMSDYLFSEGLASVYVKDEAKSVGYNHVFKHGFIDVNGKEVIPFKYNSASDFKNGVAVVYNRTGQYTGQLYYTKKGLIDKTGKELTPVKYDDMGEFFDGLAMVSVNKPNSNFADKYGFIDRTGKEVIPMIYDKAAEFSEGLAYVEHSCSSEYPYPCKKSFIDKTGKIVFTTEYSVDLLAQFSEGLLLVYTCTGEYPDQKCKYGYIDKTGKLVIPLKYDFAENFSGGLANVELNGEGFHIDKKGTELKGGKNPFDYGEEEDY